MLGLIIMRYFDDKLHYIPFELSIQIVFLSIYTLKKAT